jgi:hypothetical protein
MQPGRQLPTEADSVDSLMRADLARLVALVEESQVEEARRLSAELAERWPESRPIQRLAQALQPPRVLAVGGIQPRSFDREFAWLDAHAHEYPGCWLAIHGDHLVAAGQKRRDVVAAARAALGTDRALLFFQPTETK